MAYHQKALFQAESGFSFDFTRGNSIITGK
jgi:hypothetical protein